MRFKLMSSTAAAFAAITIASAHAFAATTVMVRESGEGGGPMTIKMDRTEIPAGPVTFKVMNGAVTEDHEMILVKLAKPDESIPVVAGKHRVDEKKLRTLGEVGGLKPNASGELTATLKPGSYVLLCNIKGHYEAGMWQRFTVNAKAASN
jgi:uncharacterized cupredoxin-like copper-binding protein